MSDKTDREAFEKRYAVLDLTRADFGSFQDYKSGGTDILWGVWQAARAELAKKIARLNSDREIMGKFLSDCAITLGTPDGDAEAMADQIVYLVEEIERLKRVTRETNERRQR